MERKQEIINALESAAVDGGFKLYVDRNRQIVAVDLFDETTDFGLCFEGGENEKDRWADIAVKEEKLIAQAEDKTCSVLEEGLRFGDGFLTGMD